MKIISKKKYKKAKQIVKLYKKQKTKSISLTDKEKLMYEIDDFEINNQPCDWNKKPYDFNK